MRTFRLPQLAETGTHPRSGARAALRFSTAFAAALPLLSPGAAGASETLSYNYDARGRLVEVDHSGTINDGIATSYTLDNADNRTSMAVSGATPPPPPTPSFAISNANVTEGGTLVFTVTKSVSASGSLSVDYASADGTATAGSDYTAASGTLTFAAADTTKTINVATTDDSVAESTETMSVTLSNASTGSTISDAFGTGSVADNDTINQPPTTVSDSTTAGSRCTITKDVLANDSDPDGNLPLTLLSVSGGNGSARVSGGLVKYDTGGSSVGETLTYTVKDSLGATSTGSYDILTIRGFACP